MLIMTMKRWQMNLQYLGYYSGTIDGIKGTKTIEGTRKFQKDNGLKVTGIVAQIDIDKMRSIIVAEQEKLNVTVDGVAGPETINARDNKKEKEELNWDNVKYFRKEEFTCKCGCKMNNIDLRLIKVLDEIREHFGQACIVTSGCRCSKHNKAVGGVQGSRHVLGKAADIYIKGVSANTLLSSTKQLVNEGTLRYTYTNNSNMNGVVHIDIK